MAALVEWRQQGDHGWHCGCMPVLAADTPRLPPHIPRRRLVPQADPSMPDLRTSLALPYGQHVRHRFDVFVPQALESAAVVVCFHGGWWSQGRHEDLRPFCLHLAEQGFACATVGYRLLGDGARHGQDIIDDAKAGALKAMEEASVDGASATSVILLGSGAGSLIALTTAAQLANDPKVRIRGAIACGVSPTLEHWEGSTTAVTRALDQFAGATRHLLSPMELKPESFPPLLLLHGDNDQDVPAKLAQRLHARAIEADETSSLAVLTGPGHQFIEQPFERGAKAAFERIVPFLREYAREPERERLFTGKGRD
jgi:acetyl esterase/lipase